MMGLLLRLRTIIDYIYLIPHNNGRMSISTLCLLDRVGTLRCSR